MSKAFMREDDDIEADVDEEETEDSTLPKGTKNYITPSGAEKLRSEFKHLKYTERPEVVRVVAWAASNGDRSENADYIYGKRRLREIDRRLRFLQKRLDYAEVVDPTAQKADRVLFGATVTIENESGQKKTYCIVGVDEVDLQRGKISWMSPLGKALLQAQQGDMVTLQTPKGDEDIEILKIEYKSIEA
jgi:transcription elongation factor GreB